MPIGSELPNNEVAEAGEGPKYKPTPPQVYEMGEYQHPVELPGEHNNMGGGYDGHGAQRYS